MLLNALEACRNAGTHRRLLRPRFVPGGLECKSTGTKQKLRCKPNRWPAPSLPACRRASANLRHKLRQAALRVSARAPIGVWARCHQNSACGQRRTRRLDPANLLQGFDGNHVVCSCIQVTLQRSHSLRFSAWGFPDVATRRNKDRRFWQALPS